MVPSPTSFLTDCATQNALIMENDFQKYIQEIQKINDGPPARYQLQPRRVTLDGLSDEDSKLRRFTLRNRDGKYENRTVLLVGAKGSGKSTLINALVNFVMGVKFEDKIWFEIIVEEKDRPQSETQTTAVSVYEVFGFEGKTVPYSLTIIDTPGYGDTRGIEYDQMITKLLEDLFCVPDGVDSIHAVGLVVKTSENRLDGRLAYSFNSVTSLFGKDMAKSIVALMTHSDGRKPKNALQVLEEAKVKCARDKNNKPIYFCFNNRQKEKIEDEDEEACAQYAFQDTENGMKKFTSFLRQCPPQSLKTTVEVMKERTRLTACIQNLKDIIRCIQNKQEIVERNREELLKSVKMITLRVHLENEIFRLIQEKEKCLDEAFQHILKLEKIALNADSVSTFVHLEFLMEKMEENGDREKVQELKRKRERMDERNEAGAKYFKRCVDFAKSITNS